MRSLLVLALVMAFTTVALAIVCEPDTCSRVHCPMDVGKEQCEKKGTVGQYRYYEHGGFCGCCNVCVKLIQLNENCEQMHIQGLPYHNVCADHLKCDSVKKVCVKDQKA